MSAPGEGPHKQEVMSHNGKPSTMLSLDTQFCRGFIFNKSTAISDMDLNFFYSEVQHIPSASDYIKTYNVHTVDISTLPFTVSGLNRHYS